MDSYRIAAVDQLRTYAEILDVPLNVVLTPAEFASSLQKMRSKDVVLVDTAGRSQRDRLKMSELRAFIEAGRPDEVHLVVSATTTRSGLAEVIERFSTVLHDRLILTKLDEAPALGPVLDLLLPGNLALSYMTTGQRVPDDIEPAEPQRVARLIMGVETVHE
jgi:flagellar biosynthesis protein FlhF